MNTSQDLHADLAVSINQRIAARDDGAPQPLFYGHHNESALMKKFMLWGGYEGVASFVGMLENDFTPCNAHEDSLIDIAFLRTYQVPLNMASGSSPRPFFRFLTVPQEPYITTMPSCLEVIRCLAYDSKFTSWIQADLDHPRVPYPGNYFNFSDEIHTDRSFQDLFYKEEDLVKDNFNGEAKEEIEKSIEAHKLLESYVKDGHLYYALFHTKRRNEDGCMNPRYVYAFALGVSPKTGNLVGVLSMGPTADVTSGEHEPKKKPPIRDEPEEGATMVMLGYPPFKAKPDGSPRHLFFKKAYESMLSTRLMLLGDYQGIVSFEGMLSPDILEENNNPDVAFLRSYQIEKEKDEGSHGGYPDYGLLWRGMDGEPSFSPVFRFICVPDQAYTDRMPTGQDIVRELRNERNFLSKYENIDLDLTELPYPGKDHKLNDEVHTDRAKQYMFSTQENLDQEIAAQHPWDGAIEIKESMGAHEKLESFMKENRLYYAVFHTKPSEVKTGVRYAFAVGVSPHTGNLVGLISMHSIQGTGDGDEEEKPAEVDLEDEGALYTVLCEERLEALPDGAPRHMFLFKKDESVLERKVMLWGDRDGIVSFEGTLSDEMKSIDGNEDTDHDISFLKTFQPPISVESGASSLPVFRFLCVPKKPYLTNVPNGSDIVRDLGYEEHFQGRQRGLKCTEIPYPGDNSENFDELHTDRTKQYLFATDEEGSDETNGKLGEEARISKKAHEELEAFVKDGHLYYGVFHSKFHYASLRAADVAYLFAVGVSPQSGNLVGAFALESARGLTC